MAMTRNRCFAFLGIALTVLFCLSAAQASTFIKCEVQNGADSEAQTYSFAMLTPGVINQARLQGHGAITPSGIGSEKVTWTLPEGVAPGERLEFRTEFTPQRYWDVYFVDYFGYQSGDTRKSNFPYAAFFVNFSETEDPGVKIATLTVVNNIAASYGLSSSEIAEAHGVPAHLVNDNDRQAIHFENIEVMVNNDLANYTLEEFDNPDGELLKLPASFTLEPGETRNFNLGKVRADAYIYTSSTISYADSSEEFPVECAHAPPAVTVPVQASK